MSILRDAIYTVILSASPMLIVAVVVGLVISVFQATTQIHEQTLAYAPKVVAILLSLLVFGSMIMNRLMSFAANLLNSVNTIIR